MPQNLYVYWGSRNSAFPGMMDIFYANRSLLAENGVLYDALKLDSGLDQYSHVSLGNLLLYGGQYRKEIDAWFRQLDELARSGKDLLVSFGLFQNNAAALADCLEHYPRLRRCAVQAVIAIGRLDTELEFFTRACCDTVPDEKAVQILLDERRDSMDALFGEYRRLFGKEHCALIVHNGVNPFVAGDGFAKDVLRACGCARLDGFLPAEDYYPRSLTACRLAHSLGALDFTYPVFRGKQALLRHWRAVELREGVKEQTYSDPALRAALRDRCAESDRRLAREVFARDTLFASPHPFDALPQADVPPLPPIEARDIDPFMEGLSPEWQTVLLRLLWTSPPQTSVGKLLLAALRQRDKKSHPRKARRFPEKSAVSVLTLTRNHEKYIERAVTSVARQETDFPIEHIIVDDASTDATPLLIANLADRYPHIKPVYLSQHQVGTNIIELFSRARSPFVALCDGDDYFTDRKKLQKQVAFLRRHPQCALCFHPVDVVYEDGSPSRTYPTEDLLPGGVKRFYTIRDLLQTNIIQTNSVMYRWRFRNGLPDWFEATLTPGDWYWHLLHAELGLIGYLPEIMSVYFRHDQSLYAAAEHDHIAHRERHGFDELRMYQAVDNHFSGKYHPFLSRLATSVFADFVLAYTRTGKDALLKRALRKYPDFGRDFLKKMQEIEGL